MLKVEKMEIAGFKPALRGMRNPYDSWSKADSQFPQIPHYNDKELFDNFCKTFNADALYDENSKLNGFLTYEYSFKSNKDGEDKMYSMAFNPIINTVCFENHPHGDTTKTQLNFIEMDHVPLIGGADIGLMTRLIRGGTVNSKFARMIQVWFDLTASFDFWKEYDTYKVGTVADSCSTMHTITKHPLSIDNFSLADLRPKDIEMIKKNIDYYNNEVLNDETLSVTDKTRIMSKLNLTGFEQKRTVCLNYEVIANMMRWRRGHKLEEWRYLCNEIFANLPYFKVMYMDNGNGVAQEELKKDNNVKKENVENDGTTGTGSEPDKTKA